MRAPEQQMAFGPDRDSNRDTRAPEGQNQHRAGHGTVGCSLERVGGRLGETQSQLCRNRRDHVYVGARRAQGTGLPSALEPGSGKRWVPPLALQGSKETSLRH